jgi:urea carboxylase
VNAIHPGYGFLSENEEFCGAVEAAGIKWLGPSAKTLHDFALKHVAREIAEKAGVSDVTYNTHNTQLFS